MKPCPFTQSGRHQFVPPLGETARYCILCGARETLYHSAIHALMRRLIQ